MSLNDIKLRDDSIVEDIDIEEPYFIIKNLEERIKVLQSQLEESNEKLFEYNMGLLNNFELEVLKTSNEELNERLMNSESEKEKLLEIIEQKDIEIISLKDELCKRKKCGRPAKYDIYSSRVHSLYIELKSIRKVVEKLNQDGINISITQVQRILKKGVS